MIAATMFFSANTVSSTNDTDLSSIIAIDAANAEDSCAGIYYFCKPGGSYCYNWTYQHYRYDSGLC